MRTVVIPQNWKFSGRKIGEIPFPENLLVGLIKRQAGLVFPRGQDVILSGDEVTLIGEKNTMLKIHELFGTPHKVIKSVVITGGSSIAIQLCKILEEQNIQVKVIEKDEETCHKLALELPSSTVLNQDMTDFNFLLSEKINHADAFVACADSSEINILSSALAKQAGCEEVIALVSDESYAPLLRRLGIFYSVSERLSIASKILSILRSENVISVSSLYDNQAKILELNVSTHSQIVGIPISDLGHFLPQDCLIAMIENRGRVLIPKGNHILSPGDTAIIICPPKHVQKLEEAF
jgi:trk system potassium uptake protein TrkA